MKTMQFNTVSSVLVLSSILFVSACSKTETAVEEAATTVITEQVLADVTAQETEQVNQQAVESTEEAAEEITEAVEVANNAEWLFSGSTTVQF